MPEEIPIGTSVQLSPEQLATATKVPEIGESVPLNPEQVAAARHQTQQLDPLIDFTSDQLVELQKQNPEFNLVQSYASRSDLQQRPGMNQKIADAYNSARRAGAFGAQLDIKKVPGQLVDIAKGFGKQLWNYAQAAATPVGAAVADISGAKPEVVQGMFREGQRQVAENIAGTEAGLQGLGKTASAGAAWIARRLKLAKGLDQYSPEEKVADLFDALDSHKQLQEISRGHGPILTTVGDEVIADLEKNGVPVRPEEVQKLSAGDPFSWHLMGSAFHGAGKLVPEVVSTRAAQVLQKAGDAAAKYSGKAVETAADVTKLGLDAAAAVAPAAATITGAVKGATMHGPLGAVTGATLGYKGGQIIAGGLRKAGAAAEKVSQVGEQVSGAPVVSPLAQLGRDVIQAAPAAAGDLAKGAAFDLGLAAVTSEESPEERAGLGIGTAFGALGAGRRVGGRVLSGQIIAPRAYGINQVTPSSGQFPALDSMHTAAIQNAEPGVAARLNVIRLFAKGTAPNTDIFLAKDGPAIEAALLQLGVNPEQAKTYSNQSGFFTTSLPGKDGSTRRVIVAQNVEAAPHESFHAIQDVLGESANREVDRMVQETYGPRWEVEGQNYARRLVGKAGLQNKTWREAILDFSGWGRAEAADKLAIDAGNQIRAATGAEPKSSDVAALSQGEWARMLADAAKRNPSVPLEDLQNNLWRDILNPQEAKDVADRYVARELAAENFDAVFKHGLNGDAGLVQKLSRIVANVVSTFGGEPLAGRASEIGKVPLAYDITQAVKGVLPVVEPTSRQVAGPKPVVRVPTGGQGIPATPEAQQNAAEEARQLAAEAPDTPTPPPVPTGPVPPGTPPVSAGTASPRELLGKIAEAIAARSGVKINYSSAPGEPAAALTSTRPMRRDIIEAFRTMPDSVRALWEKNFFPERVIKTKSGYQILGWAPEVFAANAHKLAQTMIDLKVASPYELDAANRSFSTQGWQELYNDVSTFVENQMGGRTGAGESLVVPKGVADKGFYAPPISGTGAPVDQRKADLINMLFHFKLPETPRVMAGKLPLNIAGQEVSAATQPGRVSSPVQPKAPFAGEAAEGLGIAGREIQEVNPLRGEIEREAAAQNIPMPSMIEAVQRLNLERIKEVAGAPELPQFRGNTLTLTAGFAPKTEAGRDLEKRGFNISRVLTGPDTLLYQVKNPDGKYAAFLRVGVGPTSAHVESVHVDSAFQKQGVADTLYREMATDLQERGIQSLTGEIVHPAPAKIRAELFGPMKVRSSALGAMDVESTIPLDAQFSPKESMEKLKDDSFWDSIKNYSGKYGGGVTGWAFEVGAAAKTQADVQAMKDSNTYWGEQGRDAMRDKDYDRAAQLLTKAQVAREAFEVATGQKIDGSGPAGGADMMRTKDPNYVPPVLEKPELRGQFAPPEFTEQERDTIRGAKISYPARTYADASKAATDRQGNPWIRRSATPELDATSDNSERTLLVQITSDLMNPPGNINMELSKDYYDKVYSGARSGYTRMDDFWEIPQWMGFASHIFPNADVYVVRSMPEAKQFLNTAQYKNVMFSALDVNKPFIKDLAQSYRGKVDVGGWIDPKYFDDTPNVTWHNDLASAAKANGAEFKDGVDYRHFEGSGAIPRLNMSTGCKFACAFCTVEKAVKVMDPKLIEQQADEIAKLGTELVYLGDKTFGQAPNYTDLAELNTRIKAQNPKFQGFVVQTTASTMPKLSEEWLSKSGIKFVELGIETYNDPILRAMQKPATEALMNKSTDALRKNGITLIPNIIIGLPGETAETYGRTLDFLKKNADIISHANIYNLAVYSDSKLAKEVTTASPDDYNENILEKSFHADPEVHRQFAGDLYGLASSLLDKPIEGQAQPKPDLQPRPPSLRDAEELWIGMPQTQKDKFLPVGVQQRDKSLAPGPQQRDQPERLVPAPQMQAAPKKDEYKLEPASGGFSKAWILPDGTPVQIGGMWHHEWLNANKEIRDEYGIKVGRADEDIRTKALQKGFARINYDAKDGRLTVEARETDWPTIAPVVERIITENLKQIDKVQIYQFNDRANKVSDSGAANLFDKSGTEAKLAAVPFLSAPGDITELSPQATKGALSEQATPGAMPKRGTQFQPLAAKEFDKEIEYIRDGKLDGQTFLPTGAVWNPKDKNVDIVSLASVNVPQKDLTAKAFREALAPYDDLMKRMGVVAGAFSFTQDGKPMVSIDLNAVVPQKYRDNTLAFAKSNDQISIWDADKGETVAAGGSGATKLTNPTDISAAVERLLSGEPVTAESVRQSAKESAREQMFSGFTEPTIPAKEFQRGQPAESYPEAVIPKKKGEFIPSDILNSPLAKSAANEDAAVNLFADKLVDFAKENENSPEFQLGKRWYREFTPKLKKEFGKDADIFVELLAATSPQTSVAVNFHYAYDALHGLRTGRFKKILPKFEEGLKKIADGSWEKWFAAEAKKGNVEVPQTGAKPATFLAHWILKYNLKPTQTNGKLYGIHSVPVLKVFARHWVDNNTGPKTRTFLSNLLGTGHDATIDVWADRTMRRLGYEGQQRWRILPENVAPVADKDFYFAQKAFRAAAEKLKLSPDDLQGGLWFAEKQKWADNGWGKLDLGSFQNEMEKIPAIKARLAASETPKKSPLTTSDLPFTVEGRKLKNEY